MNQCVTTWPGLKHGKDFEHDRDFASSYIPQNNSSDKHALNTQTLLHEPSFDQDSSVAVSTLHNDVLSLAYYLDNQDLDIMDASFQVHSVDICFPQLMSQQQSGLLYTQMMQSELVDNSFSYSRKLN